MGDLIFEFPMYDFLPTDFGDRYNSVYTFRQHLIADNINDEGGTPISALEVTSRDIRQEISSSDPASGGQTQSQIAPGLEYKRTIFSNVLASRIGVHVETYSVPGVTDQGRLAQMGYIEFNKRLANYNQFSMQTSYRPFVTINRPIYHVRKARMGISKSVTYTWRIRQEVSLEMDLLYTRRLEGDIANGEGTFRFITGGERQPISYRTIYEGVRLTKQGVSHSGQSDADNQNVQPTQKSTDTKSNEAGGD